MATLWVREYRSTVGGVPNAAQEPGTDQTPVTFTTSTQSAAFGAATRFIAITADANFHFAVGANPTATTGALRVTSGAVIYIGVVPGQKVAAIVAA